MRILDLGAAVLGVDECADLLHRAGAIEGDHGCDVCHAGGLQLLDVAAHAGTFQLEDPERVCVSQQVECSLVVQRHVVHAHLFAAVLFNEMDRAVEDGEVRQAKKVHLQQADVSDRLHGELSGRRRVIVTAGGTLERRVVGQRLLRDHDACRVRAGVSDSAFDTLGGLDHFAAVCVLLNERAEFRYLVYRVLDRDVEPVRDQAGEPVANADAHAERPRAVPDCGLGAERAERDDLRNVVAAVAVDAVADHLFTAVVREVHVDVRHLAPLDVEEAFKDETVLNRVYLRDLEAVEDDAGSGRAADSGEDASPVDEVEDVPADEEVVCEARLFDHVELVLEPGKDLFGRAFIAPRHAFGTEPA